MRIYEIEMDFSGPGFEGDEEELNEEEQQKLYEREYRLQEAFATAHGLTIAGCDDRPPIILPSFDRQLAAFGLEIVVFGDGKRFPMWRIEPRLFAHEDPDQPLGNVGGPGSTASYH